jgi:flavodoxin
MKAIVVYFSLEGNSKYIADKVAEFMGADTLRLQPLKDYPKGNVSKFVWGGKSVVFGEKPKLAAYDFSAADYDVIIIGTPVWAGSFTPPIKTFIRDNDLSKKKIALYACHAGGGAEECFKKLKQELGDCDVVATLGLAGKGDNQKDEYAQKIEAFCNNISSTCRDEI